MVVVSFTNIYTNTNTNANANANANANTNTNTLYVIQVIVYLRIKSYRDLPLRVHNNIVNRDIWSRNAVKFKAINK